MAEKNPVSDRSRDKSLSPLPLTISDIGMWRLSAVLIKWVSCLSEEDRLALELEWVDSVRPFLREVYEMDRESRELSNYHFVCLERQ